MQLLCRLLIAIGCVLISSRLASADEPDALPPDGWWVRYLCRMKSVNPVRTEERVEKVTISFVGTEVIDGETYRWLEISSDNGPGDDTNVAKHRLYLNKYLVAATDLLAGADLKDRVKRGWSRFNEGEVTPVDERSSPGNSQFHFVYAWKQSESVEQPKVVDYQHGRLTIPTARRIARRVEGTRETPQGSIKSVHTIEQIAWFDPNVSPAYAAYRLNVQLKRDDVQVSASTHDTVIEDSGRDAKSKLPDHH